jgi:hypothetical protein
LNGHAGTFVQGLLSDLEYQNTESIANRFGQGWMPLQWFIGMSDWDDEPFRDALARQVGQRGQRWGEAGRVIVFNPSGFPRLGHQSAAVVRPAGLGRQSSGRGIATAVLPTVPYDSPKHRSSRFGALQDSKLISFFRENATFPKGRCSRRCTRCQAGRNHRSLA